MIQIIQSNILIMINSKLRSGIDNTNFWNGVSTRKSKIEAINWFALQVSRVKQKSEVK